MNTIVFPNPEIKRFLEENAILLVKAGSHSYGTNTEHSDLDFRGCFSLSLENYMSIKSHKDIFLWKNDEVNQEGSVCDILKYIKLALDCNPNIIESMFCREDDIVYIDKRGEFLRENRDVFLSQKAAKSFMGYARSQLKRIVNHKAWIDNPINEKPKREDFGLKDYKIISTDELNSIRKIVELNMISTHNLDLTSESTRDLFDDISNIVCLALDDVQRDKFISRINAPYEFYDYCFDLSASQIGIKDSFVENLRREKRYNAAIKEWKQYNTWIKSRNSNRAELEEKFGYDTKHASHLVRLIKMAEEILKDGIVNVFREDHDELLKIRNGYFSYDEIISIYEEKIANVNNIIKNNHSVLPAKPDYDKADEVLKRIIFNDV